MRSVSWRAKLGAALVVSALALFGAHYLIFRDFHHIAIYTVHDFAFLPFEVLIVTLILHELLERRARQERLHKLNMVIGAFFSEVGTDLLRRLDEMNVATEGSVLMIEPDWSDRSFGEAKAALSGQPYELRADREALKELRETLVAKRGFLLRLLENPNLLEHESFTDLLWATFHLTEELEHRSDFKALPRSDIEHLAGDAKRVYSRLVCEWLDYARHLKDRYPYLFSLLVRTNPLDPTATIEVS